MRNGLIMYYAQRHIGRAKAMSRASEKYARRGVQVKVAHDAGMGAGEQRQDQQRSPLGGLREGQQQPSRRWPP